MHTKGGMDVRRSESALGLASYAWLLDVLFLKDPAVAWAAEGELPAGFELVEQFGVLPSWAGRSYIVSLAARRGSASALTAYNGLRLARRRPARQLLGLALRIGLAQPLLGTKVDVGAAVGSTAEELAGALISDHLGQLFGRRVVIAFGVGSGPYRKPVLQVFATDGTPLGYVKIGWNDWTRGAVRREAAALTACSARPMRLGVPGLLRHAEWNGLELIVTTPLPLGVRMTWRLPNVGLLSEIAGLSPRHTATLAASLWWTGLRARIQSGVHDPGVRGRLLKLAQGLEISDGPSMLEFGTWHGDLVPWNLARHGGRLYAWDWEDSASGAPVGFDALHYFFQVAFVAKQRPLRDSAAIAQRSASPALAAMGVPASAHRLLAMLHLLELSVRHEEARSSAGSGDDRFFPGVLNLLERAHPLGAAQPDSMGLAS
jgi:hypothetical protein